MLNPPKAMKLTHKTQLYGLILLQIISIAVIAWFNFDQFRDWHDDSLEIYYAYSSRLLQGEMPYRDYSMEYPPLALIAFCLPYLFSLGKVVSLETYTSLYLMTNLVIALGMSLTSLKIAQIWALPTGEIRRIEQNILILNALFTPLFAWRYDLFPALLTLFAVFAIFKQKFGVSGLLIGIAIGVKLYPIVLVPIFLIYIGLQFSFQATKKFIAGGLIATLTLIPFFILAPKWIFQFLSYHQERGLHLDTLYSGLIIAGRQIANYKLKVIASFSAFHLASPVADRVLPWLPFLLILLMSLITFGALRKFRAAKKNKNTISPIDLFNAITIALLVFILTNKVFSPQYLIWLLPFIPFLKPKYASMLTLTTILTLMIFPIGYQLVIEMQPSGVLLLNFRNILMLAVLIWMGIDQFLRRNQHPEI